MLSVLREAEGDLDTYGREGLCDHRDRAGSDAATHWNVGSHLKLKDSPQSPRREPSPCHAWIPAQRYWLTPDFWSLQL